MALKPIRDPAKGREFYASPREVIGAESANALVDWRENTDGHFYLEHGYKADEGSQQRGGAGGWHIDLRFCKLALWVARPLGNEPLLRGSIIQRRVGLTGPISYQVVSTANDILTARIIFGGGGPPGNEVVLDSQFWATSTGVIRREARIVGNYIELKVPLEAAGVPIGVLIYA